VDSNSTNSQWHVDGISQYIPNDKDGNLEKCIRYDPFDNSTDIECNGNFMYNNEYYKESRVIEVRTDINGLLTILFG